MNNEITITLVGVAALDYIRNENNKDGKYDELLEDYNMLLAKYNHLSSQEDLSSRVVKDSVTIKELEPKEEKVVSVTPEFAKKPTVTGRFTAQEINNITQTIKNKLPTNRDRSFSSIASSLGRSEQSLRDRFRLMDIYVDSNGICHFKD